VRVRVCVCVWLQYSVLTVLIVVAEIAGIAVSAGVRRDVCIPLPHAFLDDSAYYKAL